MLANNQMVHRDDSGTDIAARTLAALLRDIVASGRKPIETPEISDAVAVHDLRKALKRWRAILRLIAPMVGDEAELMRLEARDLAREMAAARDGQAAQEALADLGDSFPNLSARSRATIAERVAQMRARAEAIGLTPERGARIDDMWTRAAAAVEHWPFERFDRSEAAAQLTPFYRRACAPPPKPPAHASPRRRPPRPPPRWWRPRHKDHSPPPAPHPPTPT